MLLIPWILVAQAGRIDVPTDYERLQDAVEAADSNDVIVIDGGSYQQEGGLVFITRDLTLRGQGMQRPKLTELYLSNAQVTIEHVELVGDMIQVPALNAGLFIEGGSLLLRDSRISVPHMDDGADGVGVASFGAELTLDGVVAEGLVVPVVAAGMGLLTVENSDFSGNSGGALALADGDAILRNNSFSDNQRPGGGADLLLVNTPGAPGSLRVEDCTFSGSHASWGLLGDDPSVDPSASGGALLAMEVDVSITNSSFEDCSAEELGGAVVTASGPADTGASRRLDLDAVSFSGNSAAQGGGLAVLGAVDVVVEQGSFFDNQATHGGALFQAEGSITLLGGEFRRNHATLTAGAVGFSYGTEVWIDGTEFSGRVGLDAMYGGAIAGAGGRLEVHSATFQGLRAWSGAAIATGGPDVVIDPGVDVGTELVIEDSDFISLRGDGGASAVYVAGASEAWFVRNAFCGNTGGVGALWVDTSDSGDHYIKANVFFGNEGEAGAVAVASSGGRVTGFAEVLNNTFVGNWPYGVGASEGALQVTNNIFQGSRAGVGVEAAVNLGGGYNLYDTVAIEVEGSGQLPSEGVFASPRFQADGARRCGRSFWLRANSPAIDAGDPDLDDLDGTRSDIGAYGGLWADLDDLDGDGSTEDQDCDESDPSVRPGIEDVPYDDKDQDCDGLDADDLDGDGFVGGDQGTDCDDLDPEIYPGAFDALDDGVDADCNGFDGRRWLAGGGCGCATGVVGGGPMGLPWLLALLLVWRRRGPNVYTERLH